MTLTENNLRISIEKKIKSDSRIDGRWVLLLIVIFYFAVIFVSSFFMEYRSFWKTYLGVDARRTLFYDFRNITSASVCHRLGYNVLLQNPCDPGNRPMRFPRIWLALSIFGLDQSHSNLLAISCGLVFFALVFLIIQRLNFAQAAVYGLILCSPSVMLAVERGNTDLIIFALLCLSLFILKQDHRLRFFGYAVILLAAILKLYPISAAITAFRERKKQSVVVMVLVSTIFVAYITYTFDDIVRVSKLVDRYRSTGLSYGASIIFDVLREKTIPYVASDVSRAYMKLFTIVGISLVLAMAYNLARAKKVAPSELCYIDSFRMGAGVYITTFILTANYDYRLIFLILTLPQMLAWIRTDNAVSQLSSFALTSLIVTVWLSAEWPIISRFYADEIINWFLFFYYSYILLLTLPMWLKTIVFAKSNPDS